jgi:hypothetical protein
MEPQPSAPTSPLRRDPTHTCSLCGHPAVMLRRATEEWLCAPCYILTTVIRKQQIEDPIAVRSLALWLTQRALDRTHR